MRTCRQHRCTIPKSIRQGGFRDGRRICINGHGRGCPYQVWSMCTSRQKIAAHRDERDSPIERPSVIIHRPAESHHHQLINCASISLNLRGHNDGLLIEAIISSPPLDWMKSSHVSGPTTRSAKNLANSSESDAAAEYAWKNSVWCLYSGKHELG